MAEFVLSAAFTLVLVGLSLKANAAFRGAARLPMQWSFYGSVTWTAPRALALSFTPALAIFMFAFLLVMMSHSAPRPGQEGLELPILTVMGSALIAVHLLHLWLIRRTLRPAGD